MCKKENMNEDGGAGGGERAPRNLTRRGLIAGVGASIAGYLLSPCAMAYADQWYDDRLGSGCVGNQDFEVSCRFSGNHDNAMYCGSSARSESPVVRWGLSNWACGQGYLGAGISSSVRCLYENALFCYIAFEPLVKAYSRARWKSYYQGWHDIGQNTDNNYSLYFRIGTEDGADSPGKMVASVTCDLDLENPPSGVGYYAENVPEDSSHLQERYTYDYVKWDKMVDPNSIHGDARNMRKDANNIRTCDFRSRGYYYHFWCDIHGNGLDNGHTIGIDQDMHDWLCQKVPRVEACRPGGSEQPTCGIEWAGRIVAICDGNDTSKSLCVGDGSYAVSSAKGELLAYAKGGSWPDATVRLNRNWYVHLNTTGVNEARYWNNSGSGKWRGTLSIINLMQLIHHGGGASRLDQDGGELTWPKAYIADAQTYNPNGGQANQAFWIHTGNYKQYIISDASGMMLEHPFESGASWCNCKFHSNGEGLNSDVNHASHQWKLQDVIFKLRSGSTLSLRSTCDVGYQLSVASDIEANTYPFVGAGSTKLRYEYLWVRLDTSDSSYLADNVYVTGQAYHEGLGRVWITKPANNMLGALGVRALEGAALWVSGNKHSNGGIQYNFQVSGGTWDGTYVNTGALAGEQNRRNNAFVARLTGTLAERYRVHYCAGNAAGWGDWKYDGELAYCPLNTTFPNIDAIRVEIVPRSDISSASEFSSGNGTYKTTDADTGKYVACVARAVLDSSDFDRPTYLGYVATSASKVNKPKVAEIHYYADGVEKYVEENIKPGVYHYIPAAAKAACKITDEGYQFDGWYFPYGEKSDFKTPIANHYVGDEPLEIDSPDVFYAYCFNNPPEQEDVTLHYVVDGEEKGTSTGIKWGTRFDFSSKSAEYAVDGGDFYGWYWDSSYTDRLPEAAFTPKTLNKGDYYVYAYNTVDVTFKFTDETQSYFASNEPYIDSALEWPVADIDATDYSSMRPNDIRKVKVNTSVTPGWNRTTVYVERTDGRPGSAKAEAVRAVYGSRNATEASQGVTGSFTVKKPMTLYVRWNIGRTTFDGFDAS